MATDPPFFQTATQCSNLLWIATLRLWADRLFLPKFTCRISFFRHFYHIKIVQSFCSVAYQNSTLDLPFPKVIVPFSKDIDHCFTSTTNHIPILDIPIYGLTENTFPFISASLCFSTKYNTLLQRYCFSLYRR